MVSIRHKYNDGNVTISEEGVLHGKALTHDTIPALLRNGDLFYAKFGGTMHDDLQLYNPVKLANITAFWWDNLGLGNPDIEIPQNHLVLGSYYNGMFYITLKNGEIRHWENADNIKPTERPNNVVHLPRKKN